MADPRVLLHTSMGDITLALADLDLVHLSLRLVVSSVPKLQPPGPAEAADA